MTRSDYWALLEKVSYRVAVTLAAANLGSDGCTGVPDWYVIGCFDHDIAYRTHQDAFGWPITKAQADLKLKWAIQHESPFGRFSPMAQWRWLGVHLLGKWAWDRK